MEVKNQKCVLNYSYLEDTEADLHIISKLDLHADDLTRSGLTAQCLICSVFNSNNQTLYDIMRPDVLEMSLT